MKVSQLIAELQRLDPEATVLVSNKGECRVLEPVHLVDDPNPTGSIFETADGDEVTGPVVHVDTWG